jgi:hypothetical protein
LQQGFDFTGQQGIRQGLGGLLWAEDDGHGSNAEIL